MHTTGPTSSSGSRRARPRLRPGYQTLVERFLADVAADSHQPTQRLRPERAVPRLQRSRPCTTRPTAAPSLATDPLPANGCREPRSPDRHGVSASATASSRTSSEHVIGVDRLPATGRDVYFVVLPTGSARARAAGPETARSAAAPRAASAAITRPSSDGTLLYAVLPYNAVSGHCQSGNPRPNASPADPTISTISHEHNEIVTDPFGDAWVDGSGNEKADLCIATTTARISAGTRRSRGTRSSTATATTCSPNGATGTGPARRAPKPTRSRSIRHRIPARGRRSTSSPTPVPPTAQWPATAGTSGIAGPRASARRATPTGAAGATASCCGSPIVRVYGPTMPGRSGSTAKARPRPGSAGSGAR